MKQGIVTALVALVFGFAGAALWSLSGLADARTHRYLLSHPDILPAMADAYQVQQDQAKLAGIAGDIAAGFPGAVLGNPNGKRTLVEFSDYACTYCRASVADVERLIAEDKDLKVIVREWPIFEGSERAARFGLAAARQGKYAAFHNAMFRQGPPTDQTIANAARIAGLDMAAAARFAASNEASAELGRTMSFAQQLGFEGTPAWVAGDKILHGRVGPERLAEALAQAD